MFEKCIDHFLQIIQISQENFNHVRQTGSRVPSFFYLKSRRLRETGGDDRKVIQAGHHNFPAPGKTCCLNCAIDWRTLASVCARLRFLSGVGFYSRDKAPWMVLWFQAGKLLVSHICQCTAVRSAMHIAQALCCCVFIQSYESSCCIKKKDYEDQLLMTNAYDDEGGCTVHG